MHALRSPPHKATFSRPSRVWKSQWLIIDFERDYMKSVLIISTVQLLTNHPRDVAESVPALPVKLKQSPTSGDQKGAAFDDFGQMAQSDVFRLESAMSVVL